MRETNNISLRVTEITVEITLPLEKYSRRPRKYYFLRHTDNDSFKCWI
jgi:hypothetical protein